MQIFFSSISQIEQYASWPNRQYTLACPHCNTIGHGFIYRHMSRAEIEVVGKRFICSKRYNNQGCGRAIQLMLANQLPNRRYQAIVLGIFITLLLRKHSVVKAYQQATNQLSSRHAWRWLKALNLNLWRYRQFLLPEPLQQPTHLKQRLPLFLTLYRMQPEDPAQICLQFQLNHQFAFI